MLSRGLAVDIEPPVTDKTILDRQQSSSSDQDLVKCDLVEEGPVGTEEGDLGLMETDVVHLAPLVHVSVVSPLHPGPAGEGGALRRGEDRIV